MVINRVGSVGMTQSDAWEDATSISSVELQIWRGVHMKTNLRNRINHAKGQLDRLEWVGHAHVARQVNCVHVATHESDIVQTKVSRVNCPN